jgi:hypothetical protein
MSSSESFLRQSGRLAVLLTAICWPALAQGSSAPTEALLPEWLDLGVEARSRIEFRSNIGYESDRDDTINWTRLRLNVGVAPTSWLRTRRAGRRGSALAQSDQRGQV